VQSTAREQTLAGIDWGTVPAWVAAVVASTSGMLAALSYRRSVLDKERDQASKISAWSSAPEETDERYYRKDEAGNVYVVAPLPVVVYVANRSENPVYDIDLDLKLKYLKPWKLAELPPGATATVTIPIEFRDRVPKGASVPSHTFIKYKLAIPVLTFTDALGRRWQRTEDRRLRAVELKERAIEL
jgi:hypothetical protein